MADTRFDNLDQIVTLPAANNNDNNGKRKLGDKNNVTVSRENSDEKVVKIVNQQLPAKQENENLKKQISSISASANSSTKTIGKKPKNSALKQQRLPAWQPILTAKSVLPLFFSIGVVFSVLGGIILHYSNIVNEMTVDYTNCKSRDDPGLTCAEINKLSNSATPCTCVINIRLEQEFDAPVFIYYGLTNFYQNHRRYVKSRDDYQLNGEYPLNSVIDDCKPYDKDNQTNFFYAPCGAIANSLFNDTFTLNYTGPQGLTPTTGVRLLDTGIAWSTDKSRKFKNPDKWDNMIKPKNWRRSVWNLSHEESNNGYKNEDLIVWMRTAALPSFRKFHRRVDHSSNPFRDGLPEGNYTLVVNYNYPTVVFEGNKKFIISTTSWIGGKNPFLGIAYLTIGSLCIFLGFVFLVIHLKFSHNNKKQSYDVNVSVIDIQNRN